MGYLLGGYPAPDRCPTCKHDQEAHDTYGCLMPYCDCIPVPASVPGWLTDLGKMIGAGATAGLLLAAFIILMVLVAVAMVGCTPKTSPTPTPSPYPIKTMRQVSP